jgi:RAD51-like protein 2
MCASIPLEQVPCLRPLQKQILQQCCGAMYCHEILGVLTSSQIVSQCGGQLDQREADSVLDVLREHCSRETFVPLRKLLAQELARDSKRIATFSRELDALLGGGIALGLLTEVCGAPGAGKTQLSLQLGVSCFLPQAFGGIQSEGQPLRCWYIDTEGSFSSSRYREVASAAVAQVTRIANQQQWLKSMTAEDLLQMRSSASSFSVESILKNTHVSRVCDIEPFLALIHSLPSMLRDSPAVKLIVIDSIAFPFRSAASGEHSPFTDPYALHRALFHVGHVLGKVAAEFHVALIVTNQMTTRMSPAAGESAFGVSELVPALGDSWAHCVGTRVVLRAPSVPSVVFSNDNGAAQLRYAELQKSPTEQRGDCSFLVCGAGVRNAGR